VVTRNGIAYNVTGDGTDWVITWGTETVDKLGDFASNTFTCRTTGWHRIGIGLQVYEFEDATTSMSANLTPTGTNHYLHADYKTFADGNSHNFAVMKDIYMSASDTVTANLAVAGGTKTTNVWHGTHYTQFSIEWIGA
jgi:hypothetical protein